MSFKKKKLILVMKIHSQTNVITIIDLKKSFKNFSLSEYFKMCLFVGHYRFIFSFLMIEDPFCSTPLDRGTHVGNTNEVIFYLRL